MKIFSVLKSSRISWNNKAGVLVITILKYGKKKQFVTAMSIIAKKKWKHHFLKQVDKLLLFTTFEYSYDQNPSFFVLRYSWTFQNWKIFKLKQNYDLQPYLKFLQKKIKKLFFCLFFAIFCKIFIFFRKIFFFNCFSKNSFLSIFSSFYLILALIPSKCQKFVILFKKI